MNDLLLLVSQRANNVSSLWGLEREHYASGSLIDLVWFHVFIIIIASISLDILILHIPGTEPTQEIIYMCHFFVYKPCWSWKAIFCDSFSRNISHSNSMTNVLASLFVNANPSPVNQMLRLNYSRSFIYAHIWYGQLIRYPLCCMR